MIPDSISAGARQYERHTTQFTARLEPHPEHADQFRLSFAAAGTGLPVIDVSAGGLAIKTGFFIPKNMRFTLVIAPSTAHPLSDELTIKVIARRCVTLDHKPTYQIGMQFLEPNGSEEQRLIKSVVATQPEPKAAQNKRETAGVA
jgi:hypothetical protein